MDAALALARRGLGIVWPNPAVGCVLVQDGVVGRGWTQPGGRPHAEAEALRAAGAAARGATAYVTLEPCDHYGQTPPCSQALIDAGVARAVIAIEDPDPRVSGKGVARLRHAGISVSMGVRAEAAAALNAGFLSRVRLGRPLVTWKAATSLDGRIATRSGESQWITGALSRDRTHLLRADHDAVLIGVGTAAADDPKLTCRLPGLRDRSPLRIVVDPRLRLPLTSLLVREAAKVPTWIACLEKPEPARAAAYRQSGVELIEIAPKGDQPDMTGLFAALGARGLTRVLVEGGGRVVAALLAAGLIDRAVMFRAGPVIGGDGVPAVAGFGLEKLVDAPRFRLIESHALDGDMMEIWAR